jgi:hypothetical protein
MKDDFLLQARLRKDDILLKKYFSKIKKGDWPYEIRRLLEKSIKTEQKEKQLLEKAKENQE